MTATLKARFDAKVAKGDEAECWPWLSGAKSKDGYGLIWCAEAGRQRLSHRVAWEMENGPIPAGMCVLHRCDNPPCVNPAHLFLGTLRDNTQDMIAKGRHVSGFGNRAKTHCKNGHEFTIDNTGRKPDGRRWCRECSRRSSRQWHVATGRPNRRKYATI